MNIEFNPVRAINGKHRKEKHFYKEIAVISKSNEKTIIVCRFYKTQTYYFCCTWVESGNIFANGSAKEYSFHNALNVALQNCGVTMPEFYAREKENLIELAKAIFHEDEFIFHVAHG